MRAIVATTLTALVACANAPGVTIEEPSPPKVVITLAESTHSGSWPTARAELGRQAVAMCPIEISIAEGSDELSCDYEIGPLIVPETFEIYLDGDADEAVYELTANSITVDARWADTRVWYRVDLERGSLGPVDPATASEKLRVVCDEHSTTVLTPVVRAQREGLRFVIEAGEGVKEYSFHRVAWEHGMSVGGNARWAGDVNAVGIEPGKALVACLSGPRKSYWEVAFGTFELIDPDGWWLTSGIDCDRTITIARQLTRDYRSVPYPRLDSYMAEALSGLEPGDVVRHEGYPDGSGSKLYLWDGLVVRDGSRVAIVQLDWDGELRAEVCAGSGISLRSIV